MKRNLIAAVVIGVGLQAGATQADSDAGIDEPHRKAHLGAPAVRTTIGGGLALRYAPVGGHYDFLTRYDP